MCRVLALLALLLALPLHVAAAQEGLSTPLIEETIALEPGQWWVRSFDIPDGELSLTAVAAEGRVGEPATVTLSRANEWVPRLDAPISTEQTFARQHLPTSCT